MNKMSKEDRDIFVERNHSTMTGNELVGATGWSLTTIKSIKRRLGTQRKSSRVLEMEEYAVRNYDGYSITDKDIADKFEMKHDNVRDSLKFLGIYKSPSTIAAEALFRRYSRYFNFLSDYKDTKSGLTLECKSCGEITTKRANSLVTNRFSCKKCSGSATCYERESYYRKNEARTIAKKFAERSLATGTSWRERILHEGYTLSPSEVIKNQTSIVSAVCTNGHTRNASVRNILRYNCAECSDSNIWYLYIMRSGNMYKLGVSSNVEHRLTRIKASASLEDLEILYKFEGTKNLVYSSEKYWHSKLADKNCLLGAVFDGSTEFFFLSPQDLEEIIKTPLII
jgi:hypothetical protein